MRYSTMLCAALALASSAWTQSSVTALTSGVSASFTVPRATGLQPVCCFSIAVPANATRLEVRASLAAGVQFAIGVKFGSTFSGTRFDADNGGIVGENPLVVTRQSSPPLRTGTNYISLLLVAPPQGMGTVTATVTAGAPAITLSATSLDFGTVVTGQNKDLTFLVRNTGTEALTVASMTTSNAQFRVVTPSPFTVAAASSQTVAVRFTPNASGAQSGTLTIASNDTTRPSVTISLTGAGGPPPPPLVTSVSAATLAAGPVSPESLVSSFGEGLATAEGTGDPKELPTSIGGTSLTVKDSAGVERPAQLLLVTPKQVNYLVPAGTSSGAATVTVTLDGKVVGAGPLQVDAVAPGLFSANGDGKGVAAAVAQRVAADGSTAIEDLYRCGPEPGSCVLTPIDPGPETDQVLLMFSGTGIRGRSAPEAVTATIGGVSAEVLSAAAQSENPGKDQVVARLPRALSGRGEVDVALTVDGKRANTVTIQVGGPAPPTPAAVDFLPLRTGLSWNYRVSFASAVALPYQPIVEEPDGLLCSNIFCGSRNWPVGQIEFKLTVNESVGPRNGAESWSVAATGQGPAFFFGQNFPMEMRVRMVGGSPRLELLANVGTAFRIYRPLAYPQASDLSQPSPVTTPAGEFRDAVKTSIVLQGLGAGSVSGTFTTDVWVAPGAGIVKAVQRDSTGRILYTQELTERGGS